MRPTNRETHSQKIIILMIILWREACKVSRNLIKISLMRPKFPKNSSWIDPRTRSSLRFSMKMAKESILFKWLMKEFLTKVSKTVVWRRIRRKIIWRLRHLSTVGNINCKSNNCKKRRWINSSFLTLNLTTKIRAEIK